MDKNDDHPEDFRSRVRRRLGLAHDLDVLSAVLEASWTRYEASPTESTAQDYVGVLADVFGVLQEDREVAPGSFQVLAAHMSRVSDFFAVQLDRTRQDEREAILKVIQRESRACSARQRELEEQGRPDSWSIPEGYASSVLGAIGREVRAGAHRLDGE